MALTLKELAKRENRFLPGHRACPGCAAPIVIRHVLLAIEYPVVVTCATGCMEVASTIYPYTAWGCPFLHNAFENSAATCSGIETAYRALKKKGRISDEIKFVAFGGDGGTYDIGLQSLSGAMERNHDMLYVCYDNEAYMNTGIQRSGATPRGASTNTAPAGSVIPGKTQANKDLTAIIAAHNIPYVAQAAVHNWKDLATKVKKAVEKPGAAFINVFAPCYRGWRAQMESSIELSRLAVDTCFWPLYEVEDGVYRLNFRPKEKLPITKYTQTQGRFSHLSAPENAGVLKSLQGDVDSRWERLVRLCEQDEASAGEEETGSEE
jgi:pyruvate ferredoxin oxidoreductase beta subunit